MSNSGQSEFYQESDWAQAAYVAEIMTRNLATGKVSANLFAAIQSAMGELLTSEGARRRVRVELQKPNEAEKPSLALVKRYRENASS